MVPRDSIPAKHVWVVVRGYDVVNGAGHPCQIFSMPYITLSKQWDGIYIQVSSSLDHYATADVHDSSSWFIKAAQSSVTPEHV